MDYIANVENSEIDVSGIRTVLVQGDSSYPIIRFVLDPSLTGLSWRVRGTYAGTTIAVLSPEITAVESGTEITLDWSVSSDFTTYDGDMQLVLVGSNDAGTTVVKALAEITVQKDWSIGTTGTITLNLFEQLMAQANQDLSALISAHNTDAGAHANLGIVDTGGYYDAATVEGALQEVGADVVAIQADMTELQNTGVDTTARADIADIEDEILKTVRDGNLYIYPDHYLAGKWVGQNGAINTAATWGAVKIPVISNESYVVYMPNVPNNYDTTIGGFGFYNGTTLLSATYNPAIAGYYNSKSYVVITTPANCTHLAFTCKRGSSPAFDDSQNVIFLLGSIINSTVITEAINTIGGDAVPDRFPYRGKKWAVVGDSLTEFNLRATKNYHHYISEELGLTVYNMGASGSGYKRDEGAGKAFYQRIASIPTNTDVVTIFGSGNDMTLIADLGTETDSTTATICGCINATINALYAVLPTVRLGIIAPTPWGGVPPTTPGNSMELICDKLQAICKLRGIPYLDLYHSSGLRPWEAAYLPLMYSRDAGNNVHPDENGHRLIAGRIREFVRSLLVV